MNLDKKVLKQLQKEANNAPIEHQKGSKAQMGVALLPIASTLRNKGMTWPSVAAWFGKHNIKIDAAVLCNLWNRHLKSPKPTAK